jgi:sugar/nucleoside kinase (ribokinase family)
MTCDYASVGFYTYDCLGWPFEGVPPGGGTYFIDEMTVAVSGAAGAAVIAGAKVGLSARSVGGVGRDVMGDWVLDRLRGFGIDTTYMRRFSDTPTASSIVTTRADGSRPALHVKGATRVFTVDESDLDAITDAKVLHLGGVGLLDAMDGEGTARLMAHARARGAITTVDVFAGSQADLPDVEAVLPHTDYFIPSIEEAEALSGMTNIPRMASFFLDKGAQCCIFTLGAHGAYYQHRDGTRLQVPAHAVDVKCTCGCGDIFNAGIATALVRGMPPRDALRFASAMSALNASGLGSQAGIENFDQVVNFMNSCPTKEPELLIGAA